MTTAVLIGTDVHLRDAVLEQLDWDPRVAAATIGVVARNGTVTLTGFIATLAGKLAAETAVKQVHGVRRVANDVEVRPRVERTDRDIALDAARALRLRSILPASLQIVVRHGHVMVTGTVERLYQKEMAEEVVRNVRGVQGVANHITRNRTPLSATFALAS